MELDELTAGLEKVSEKYAGAFSIRRTDEWYILKVQEELGELTQKYLMMAKQARAKGLSDADIKKEFENEVADLFCHVLLLSGHFKIDLQKRIEEKWLSRLKD